MFIQAIRRALRAFGFACAAAPMLASAAHAAGSEADTPLDLPQTVQLAGERQPMLDALAATARAAHETAVADRQLPDPQLFGGVRDLPIDGDDAYSFTRDSDTQIVAGLMQEFPLAAKRRLRGQRGEQTASRLDALHALAQRTIARDSSLAWLAVWARERDAELLDETLREAQTQSDAVAIAVKTGRAPQAELFAARVDIEMLRDRIAENAQATERARNGLSRWIGDAALRPLTIGMPASAPLPPLPVLLAALPQHPQLQALEQGAAAAQTGADLAKADYKPDWRVELGYGNRSRYSDMVMLQVGVDLPLFTANRQDRRYAAALAERDAASAERDDALRELSAEARADYQELQRLDERLAAHETRIVPPAVGRVDAALAAWRSGTGTLAQVLDARRALLDIHMSRVQLQEQAAGLVARLQYLGAYDARPIVEGSSP